jgi:hypothetical protein
MVNILAVSSAVTAQQAAGAVAACAGVTDVKSKSRQYFDGQTLMTSLLVMQGQGEKEFGPKYAPPKSECLLETFDVAGVPVAAIYSPFEKGDSALHYRFTIATASENREILVYYDSLATLMSKKDAIFFVIENRKGNISYYAMFRDQPTYVSLKPVIVAVVDGNAKPLATVRWPPGAKEPVIDAYDTKRLK